MESRADRVYTILKRDGPRLKVYDIRSKLAKEEKVALEELVPAIVSATVRQDNASRVSSGRVRRFRTYGDGDEEHGFVSLLKEKKVVYSKVQIIANYQTAIPALIEEANDTVRASLKEAIGKLSWRQFEANFLAQVLEALGYSNVEITRPTKDGGKDAICTYKRGLVASEAIVSAKHWKGANVPYSEVQRLRGIKGNADTAIIVTSSAFTREAVKEAVPGQNIRTIYLIDGDMLVDTCLKSAIGIKAIETPQLYKFVGLAADDGS